MDIYKSSLQMIQQLKQITKDDNLHLIIPLLIRVISRQNYGEQGAEIDFKIEVVRTVNSLVCCKSFREYIATIVHSMINVVEVYQTYNIKEADHLYKSIVDLFCHMARRLNIDFAPFIPMIQESFKRCKRPSAEFSLQVEGITKINLVDLFKQNLENNASDHADELNGPQYQNFGQFLTNERGAIVGGNPRAAALG